MIILGDFNLHLDIASHHTVTFTDNLTSFGLLQHVNFPNHIHGHWLDLYITRSASQIVSSIFISDGLSDHLTVIAELRSNLHRHTAKKQITYRRINQIDINNFKIDIVKSQLITNPKLSADSLYKQFHDTLSSILNTQAPLKTKSVSPKSPNPWITPAIQAAKRTRRYLERVWWKSRFSSDRSKYVKQAHLCNRMMERARREHIANYIHDNENNAGKLWGWSTRYYTQFLIQQCLPQVISPHFFLFTLYTTLLSSVISRHTICQHLYADDTQIYLSLFKTDPEMPQSLVQQCLQDVSDWMIASRLKLNPDKTAFIIIGTKAQRDKFKKYFPTKLLDQDVTPTDSARNLGVEFDKDFNLKKNISKVCRSCYYHMRDLRRLRGCLTAAVTKTIATSLVSSKLDYCNSILYNIPNREINKVQSVQNCLARVVTRSPRFCSVTPLLKSLHWLPV